MGRGRPLASPERYWTGLRVAQTVVVDSYAWVEYGEGTSEGEAAQAVIEGDTRLLTPAIVVGELTDRAVREGMESEWEERLRPFIQQYTMIVPIDAAVAERAGHLKWEMRDASPETGLADAIILAVARDRDAAVLTGDPDFLLGARDEEVIDLTENAPD